VEEKAPGGPSGGPGEVETYSIEEAGKVLGRTPGRIRQMLRAGELAGEHEGGDPARPWRVPKWAVHALKDETEERAQESARTPRELSKSTAVLMRKVQDLQRELGCMEGRLELTATAESTLRDSLERERPGRTRRGDVQMRRGNASRR
jgi:hypothetical protein